jgi:hypothetical protein
MSNKNSINKSNSPSTSSIKNNSKSPNSVSSNKIVAPTINNKSTKSTSVTNIALSSNDASTFQTAKEEAGVYEVVSTNYMLLIGIASALIIILIVYLFSSSFRVGRAVSNMVIYQGYQQISTVNIDSDKVYNLGQYHVASAYNAAHSGYQMYDYTSEKIVLSIIQSGVRYLEFNIFNSEFGDKAYPVVSMGYMVGEWKMMVNDTPLETIFEIISKNAFKLVEGTEGVNNPNDPLIIGLKLNTNSNLNCLNLIAYLIVKYFGKRLLDSKYSFQQNDNIASVPMSKLVGSEDNTKLAKVIIFSSDGFQGSGLDEIINYSWDNVNNSPHHSLQRLLFTEIIDPSYNSNALIEFNKSGMTIIVNHVEGDFFNNNYDPTKAFDYGCQLVTMEYQSVDSYMDIYMKNFKYSAFVLKDSALR